MSPLAIWLSLAVAFGVLMLGMNILLLHINDNLVGTARELRDEVERATTFAEQGVADVNTWMTTALKYRALLEANRYGRHTVETVIVPNDPAAIDGLAS